MLNIYRQIMKEEYEAVWEITARQLAKCECKMILASISMQVLAILASLHVVWNTIIYGSPVDVTKEIVRNQLNGLIEHDSIACSDKIVHKHKFLFKLSLANLLQRLSHFLWKH